MCSLLNETPSTLKQVKGYCVVVKEEEGFYSPLLFFIYEKYKKNRRYTGSGELLRYGGFHGFFTKKDAFQYRFLLRKDPMIVKIVKANFFDLLAIGKIRFDSNKGVRMFRARQRTIKEEVVS